MSVTLNGKPPRKQLGDQLDRLDGIIDVLADAIPGAVADATREGARAAVREVVAELLASPELRALIGELSRRDNPVPAPAPSPTPAPVVSGRSRRRSWPAGGRVTSRVRLRPRARPGGWRLATAPREQSYGSGPLKVRPVEPNGKG